MHVSWIGLIVLMLATLLLILWSPELARKWKNSGKMGESRYTVLALSQRIRAFGVGVCVITVLLLSLGFWPALIKTSSAPVEKLEAVTLPVYAYAVSGSELRVMAYDGGKLYVFYTPNRVERKTGITVPYLETWRTWDETKSYVNLDEKSKLVIPENSVQGAIMREGK